MLTGPEGDGGPLRALSENCAAALSCPPQRGHPRETATGVAVYRCSAVELRVPARFVRDFAEIVGGLLRDRRSTIEQSAWLRSAGGSGEKSRARPRRPERGEGGGAPPGDPGR